MRRTLRETATGLGMGLAMLAAGTARAQSKCPDVMIVLDTSGSMDWPPNGSTSQSKIDIAKQVLHDVVLGGPAAPVPDSRLRFGFTHFPADTGGCDTYSATQLPVAPGYGTNSNIDSAVQALQPNGSTPTPDALDAVKGNAEMMDAARPRYVILVTDGEPNCLDSVSSSGNAGTDSVSSVQALHQQGAKTFVVGFGNTGADATLQAMAQAGQDPYPDGGPTFYQASDTAALAAALQSALSQASGELGTGGCNPCLDLTCPTGKRCNVQNGMPTCVVDPCAGVSCDGGFCRNDSGTGNCVGACPQGCPSGQACVDGQCQTDSCASVTCSPGQVCVAGTCQADQCANISCPSGTFCKSNNCAGFYAGSTTTTGSGSGSGGASGTGGSTGGLHKPNGDVTTSGCGCQSATLDGTLWALVALLGLASLRRRHA